MKVDIEVYKEYGDPYWAQAKYLVHGKDDVLWTNSLDEALDFIKSSLIDDTPEDRSPAGGGSQPYKCASCPNFHERGYGCDTPEEIDDPYLMCRIPGCPICMAPEEIDKANIHLIYAPEDQKAQSIVALQRKLNEVIAAINKLNRERIE